MDLWLCRSTLSSRCRPSRNQEGGVDGDYLREFEEDVVAPSNVVGGMRAVATVAFAVVSHSQSATIATQVCIGPRTPRVASKGAGLHRNTTRTEGTNVACCSRGPRVTFHLQGYTGQRGGSVETEVNRPVAATEASVAGDVDEGLVLLSMPRSVPTVVGLAVKPTSAPPVLKLLWANRHGVGARLDCELVRSIGCSRGCLRNGCAAARSS